MASTVQRMGCTVSTAINTLDVKQKNAKKVPGNETIKETGTEEKDKFDPRLPLTVRQKFNITKSWKAIARNMEVTGINMFVRWVEPPVWAFSGASIVQARHSVVHVHCYICVNV